MKVTILQHRLLHYRVELFERLRSQLQTKGIELCLVHGQASESEKAKRDEGYLSWSIKVVNRYWKIGGTDLCWQPVPEKQMDSDLIVIMQENRILTNYWLFIRRLLGGPAIAYWGHGENFQKNKTWGLREWWKRRLLTQADWWFAYTEETVNILRNAGYPLGQITCLNNAIDNTTFQNDLNQVSENSLDLIRQKLCIEDVNNVGLYCGSLYPEKRLNFLVEAADLIREKIPNFHLIVIGDGPSAPDIKEYFSTRSWAHWVGIKTGKEKAAYYKLAKIILNPGLVGLHVLDAFCAGLPLVSTSTAKHSPEVVYLEHGISGYLTNDSTIDYADTVIQLLDDPKLYQSMTKAALHAAEKYTLGNMINNFVSGICKYFDTRK